MAAIRDLRDAFSGQRVSHSFEVVDDASTTFRSEHQFDLRAELRSRFFIRQYIWTGSGNVDEPTPELDCDFDDWGHPLQRIHGPVIVDGKNRIVLVDLGRTFSVGDTTTVKFSHRLKDLGGSFVPYIGHTPQMGLKHVSLSVTLPPSLAHDVVFEECTVDNDKAIHVERLSPSGELLGGRLRFERHVPQPVTDNRRYQITWPRPQ